MILLSRSTFQLIFEEFYNKWKLELFQPSCCMRRPFCLLVSCERDKLKPCSTRCFCLLFSDARAQVFSSRSFCRENFYEIYIIHSTNLWASCERATTEKWNAAVEVSWDGRDAIYNWRVFWFCFRGDNYVRNLGSKKKQTSALVVRLIYFLHKL